MIERLVAALGAALLAIVAVPAAAHLTPNSELRLRFEPGLLRADALIPVAEYSFATGLPATDLDAMRGYLLTRTRAAAPDGRAWRVAVEAVRVEPAPGGPDIRATLTYTPPPGAPDRRLSLEWDVVIREADNHFALALLEGDLARGVGEANDLIGTFSTGRRTIEIDRGAASRGALFAGALQLGARHILAGHDHLLFLLALLLPAPLLARAGRWAGPRPPRQTLTALALIVTAFTLGHSVTLIAAAAFDARLPVQPVEAGIALSVLISALHAFRPIFAGRESWIALGFGLVHGLAFATVVAGFGVSVADRAAAILGFNLGIEAVQLALVLLLLPALLIGARRPWYPRVRLALAFVAALAALIWLVERVSGRASEMGEAIAAALPPLALALVAVSLAMGAAWLARRRFAVAAATNRA